LGLTFRTLSPRVRMVFGRSAPEGTLGIALETSSRVGLSGPS
jgi:hypothetical protein